MASRVMGVLLSELQPKLLIGTQHNETPGWGEKWGTSHGWNSRIYSDLVINPVRSPDDDGKISRGERERETA